MGSKLVLRINSPTVLLKGLFFIRTIARFYHSVPALQAAPQLSCVRSLRCSIQRYQGCYVVNGMCHCAQAWCCDNPFNFTSLDNCLAVKENTFQLGK